MSFFHVRETKVDNKRCGQIEPAYLFSAMVDELPHCLCHVSLSFPTLYEMLQFNTLGSCFHPHHFYPQEGAPLPPTSLLKFSQKQSVVWRDKEKGAILYSQ